MFCQWCGKNVRMNGGKCPACGREQDALIQGNGFWDLCGETPRTPRPRVQTPPEPVRAEKKQRLNPLPIILALVCMLVLILCIWQSRVRLENQLETLEQTVQSVQNELTQLQGTAETGDEAGTSGTDDATAGTEPDDSTTDGDTADSEATDGDTDDENVTSKYTDDENADSKCTNGEDADGEDADGENADSEYLSSTYGEEVAELLADLEAGDADDISLALVYHAMTVVGAADEETVVEYSYQVLMTLEDESALEYVWVRKPSGETEWELMDEQTASVQMSKAAHNSYTYVCFVIDTENGVYYETPKAQSR